MTFSIVQEAQVAVPGGSASPTIAFGSAPTPGNLILLVWSGSEPTTLQDQDEDPTLPVGWARLYFDNANRLNGYGRMDDAHAAAGTGVFAPTNFPLAIYVKVATVTDTAAITMPTLASLSKSWLVIGYELAGTYEADVSVVQGWTRAASRANLVTALSTDGGPDDGKATATPGPGLAVPDHTTILAVGQVNAVATFTRTLSADRTDLVQVSTGIVTQKQTLSCSVIVDADAGTYADAISWSGGAAAITLMLGLRDKGPGVVLAADLAAQLSTISSDLTAAALEDAPLAADLNAGATTATALSGRFDRAMTRKSDLTTALDGVNVRALLADHDPMNDVPVYGEPFTPDPARVMDGAEISYLLAFQLAALPTGYALKVPVGRYRAEIPQKIDTMETDLTFQGEGLGSHLPTFYRAGPLIAEPMIQLSGIDTITVDKLRLEGTNLSRHAGGEIGDRFGQGGTVYNPIPADYVPPVDEADWPDYNPPMERAWGLNVSSGIASINAPLSTARISKHVTVTDVFTYGIWGYAVGLQPNVNLKGFKVEDVTVDRLDARYGYLSLAVLGIDGGSFTNIYSPNASGEAIDFEDRDSVGTVLIDTVYSDAYNEPISVGRHLGDLTIRNIVQAQGGALGDKQGGAYLLYLSGATQVAPVTWLVENVSLGSGEWTGGRRSWGGVDDPLFPDAAPFSVHHFNGTLEIRNCTVPIAADSNIAEMVLTDGRCRGQISIHDNDFSPGGIPGSILDQGFLGYLEEAGLAIVDVDNIYNGGVGAPTVHIGIGAKYIAVPYEGALGHTHTLTQNRTSRMVLAVSHVP